MAWYKNGRVSINTGDTYLTGTNTRFASNTRVGDAIRAPDGEWYELVNTSSETVLGIYPPYRGPSVVDSTDYMIAPIQGYNKETADRLRYITDNIRDFSEDVNAARQSAEMAKVAEIAAEASASKAKGSEDKVAADAKKATDAAANALVSENNASQSQQATAISELNAKKSETNSSISESNSAASESAAANSAEAARLSALAASMSELNAATSEQASKVSETNAKESETSANEDAMTANTDAATATQARIDALEALRLAEKARDDAQAAANANTGQVQDLGMVDLSSGAYPARPIVSSFWYVEVGGTVVDNGETIEYGKGDVLRFSKPLERFYKVDNTESVTSVAGKTGVVTLNKADVGLDKVDNTSDLAKPISTAVAAELAARTVTQGREDKTAQRLVKVGDYGENGGDPIFKGATDDANALSVSGTYIFPNGGLNLPTSNVYYVKHISYPAAGYAKQFAYSISQNSNPYVRTQINGVWSQWRTFTDIVDNLSSTRNDAALSANQGRLLQEQLQANNATIVQYNYNVAAGQLVVSGNDISGKSLSYVPGAAIIVSLNGFNLIIGSDFTATTGTSISLTRAAEQASEMTVTVFGAFAVANHYTKSELDARLQQVVTLLGEPVLTIKWVPARGVIPQGCFPLDGSIFSRDSYPEAWDLINTAGKVPVTDENTWSTNPSWRAAFTKGNGVNNFRIPDYNAQSAGVTYGALFLRGDGNRSGPIGFVQSTQNIAHAHTIATDTTGANPVKSGSGGSAQNSAAVLQYLGTDAPAQYPIYASTVGSGGDESRPNNVAGVWIIRLLPLKLT